MERGKLAILLVLLVLYIVVIGYLFNVFSQLSTSYDYSDDNSVELYSLLKIDSEHISLGQTVDLSNGDVVSLNLKNTDYSFKVLTISASENKVEMVVDKGIFFFLNGNDEKKLDLDNDNIYDVSSKIESMDETRVKIYFKQIDERKNFFEAADDNVVKFFERAEKNYQIQLGLILVILLVFLVLLILYIVKSFIAPSMKLKRIKDREKPSDALGFLISEFEEAKNNNDKVKTKKLAQRIKHLYKYLDSEDKKNYLSKVKSVEKYL